MGSIRKLVDVLNCPSFFFPSVYLPDIDSQQQEYHLGSKSSTPQAQVLPSSNADPESTSKAFVELVKGIKALHDYAFNSAVDSGSSLDGGGANSSTIETRYGQSVYLTRDPISLSYGDGATEVFVQPNSASAESEITVSYKNGKINMQANSRIHKFATTSFFGFYM